jgi:hypothetical protein
MLEYSVIQKVFPSQLEQILNEWAKGEWRLWGYTGDYTVILEREKE